MKKKGLLAVGVLVVMGLVFEGGMWLKRAITEKKLTEKVSIQITPLENEMVPTLAPSWQPEITVTGWDFQTAELAAVNEHGIEVEWVFSPELFEIRLGGRLVREADPDWATAFCEGDVVRVGNLPVGGGMVAKNLGPRECAAVE
jgi:hypothetical protein